MRNLLPKTLAFALLAAPALAQTSPPAAINFSNYYVIGDSLASGFVSGALVVTHQNNSVPRHIARQAGVPDFQQPTVSEPGIPVELALQSLNPAPIIAPKAGAPGAPTNLGLTRSYNNMAVPGATLIDALTRTTDNGGLHDLILRGRGTQVQQVVAARPSVITVWIGNNDVLGAAVRGRAIDNVTLTPAATFRQAYQQLITTLNTTGARIFAANLPDVTSIPFVTTIPPVVVNPSTGQPVLVNGQPVPLIGPSGGPLPTGSLVTLAASSLLAQGHGIPTSLGGRGTPLPDEVVLDPTERQTIVDRVNANNQAIRDICGAANVPVLDQNAILRRLATEGEVVGGVTYTGAFLTGGVFSYDGVHPTDMGYAISANEWIRLLNANGGALPEVDLQPFTGISTASASASAARTPAVVPHTAWEFSAEAYAELLAAFPTLDRP
jgi:lysophospholipase L1-like esterase